MINLLWPINPFRFLFRLGKVVNKKKVHSEGFEKYFKKGGGKFISNDVDLPEVVAKDENKKKDGVSFCLISVPGFMGANQSKNEIHSSDIFIYSFICSRYLRKP